MFLINFPIDAAKLLFFFDMRKKIVLNYTKSRSFQFFNVCLSYSSACNTHGIVRSAPNTKARIFVFIVIVFMVKHVKKCGIK